MARVASNHCLGILVIDEIQDLSEAKSGGDSSMLSFFVHLENRIGVPFILIGTPQAIPILSGQFRHARRVSEQGDIVWNRMNEIKEEVEWIEDNDDEDYQEDDANTITERTYENKEQEVDPVWRDFVETLWAYQYVTHVTQLKENLLKDRRARALYAVSKGIPAVALTVFVLAQRRAINSGIEKITSGTIRSVAHDSQNLIKSMLDKPIRRSKAIPTVEDLTDWDFSGEALKIFNDLLQPCPSDQPDDEVSNVTLESKTSPRDSQKDSRKRQASKEPAQKRGARYSKDDLRNSANDKRSKGNSKTSPRSKFNKSLAEYI